MPSIEVENCQSRGRGFKSRRARHKINAMQGGGFGRPLRLCGICAETPHHLVLRARPMSATLLAGACLIDAWVFSSKRPLDISLSHDPVAAVYRVGLAGHGRRAG